jgi:hypothetical protein
VERADVAQAFLIMLLSSRLTAGALMKDLGGKVGKDGKDGKGLQ